MDDLWTMTLLGQEEPGLWRMLAPVIIIGVFAVVRWLNEKSKQKEGQQQVEDEGGASRAKPVHSEQAQRAQRTPLPQARHQQRPGAAKPSQAQPRQLELIIEAEDISAETAQRQFQREQQLRDGAVSQARDLQAERRREAARKAEPAHPRSIELKPSGQLPTAQAAPGTELFQARTALLAPGEGISQPQVRRAIVWAEILGPPRALRPYEQLF